MKKLRLLAILLILSSSSNFAKEVPLEVFAKPATYKTMRISPSGKYLAFTYEDGNEVKLGVINRETKQPSAGFEFGENRHITNFTWLNDERISMTVQTIIGWLDGTQAKTHWNVANADGSNRMTVWDHLNFGSLVMLDKLDSDPDHVLAVKRQWQDGGRAKLYRINTSKGDGRFGKGSGKFINDSPPAAAHTEPGIVGFGTDLDSKVMFAFEYDRGEDENIPDDDKLSVHFKQPGSNKWQRLYIPSERKTRPSFAFLGMNKGNDKAYFSSNFDLVEKDTTGLFQFDLVTKEIELLYRHPDVDIQGTVTGDEQQIIGVRLEPGYPMIHYIESDENLAEIKLHKGLSGSFPGQYVSITSRTSDKTKYLLSVRSDKNPGDFYLFDREAMNVSYLGSSKPEIDTKLMAKVEPFIMNARDGLQMYGYLTIPNNVEEKNLPMVVYPHGGPYGVRDSWRWDRRAQMLASRGYLVLQLNFRGSGGYGNHFERAGYTEWGAKMQDDLTDATHWAIKQGLADPDRICIHGVSYGGYASMNAVVKEPDLYKCSIPDAGVYEMKVQWDEADSFKGRGGSDRKEWYMKRTIGGYDKVEERSPVYHVNKLKADLFIVHGGEDVRVPIINAEILEDKLKQADKNYIKLYKDEEGHGFTQVKNRVELYEQILEFLDKNIGE